MIDFEARAKEVKNTLPGWAQRCQEVIYLSAMSPTFRRDVREAKDPRLKRHLIRMARKRIREISQC